MRPLLTFLLPIAALICFSSPGHAAQATTNMNVSASIAPSCILKKLSDLNFGLYDSVAMPNSDHDGTGMMAVACTKGTPYLEIFFDDGLNAAPSSTCAAPQRRLRSSNGDYISYGLYQDSPRTKMRGCASGVNTHLPIPSWFVNYSDFISFGQFGRIFRGQSVPVGDYTDTVNVTVVF